MRIISGSFKGRKLFKLQGRHIRPTSDRIREAVFNILGQKIKNANVLDLFAGTGALGIEALSRGADNATFIDRDCDVIHKNICLCGVENKTNVICLDIVEQNFPKNLASQVFDIVFIDPPYGKGYIEYTLKKKAFMDMISKNSIIIAETSYKENLAIPHNFDIYRQKKYSKTRISFMSAMDKHHLST